jgi:hypothetical protein
VQGKQATRCRGNAAHGDDPSVHRHPPMLHLRPMPKPRGGRRYSPGRRHAPDRAG